MQDVKTSRVSINLVTQSSSSYLPVGTVPTATKFMRVGQQRFVCICPCIYLHMRKRDAGNTKFPRHIKYVVHSQNLKKVCNYRKVVNIFREKSPCPARGMKGVDISDVAWNPGPSPDAAGLVRLTWPDTAVRYRMESRLMPGWFW